MSPEKLNLRMKKLLQEEFAWNLNYCHCLIRLTAMVLLDPSYVMDDVEAHPCVQEVDDLLSVKTLDDSAFQGDVQHPDAYQMESKAMPCVLLVAAVDQIMNLVNFDYVLCDRFFAEQVTVYEHYLHLPMKADEEAYDSIMELALAYLLEVEILP